VPLNFNLRQIGQILVTQRQKVVCRFEVSSCYTALKRCLSSRSIFRVRKSSKIHHLILLNCCHNMYTLCWIRHSNLLASDKKMIITLAQINTVYGPDLDLAPKTTPQNLYNDLGSFEEIFLLISFIFASKYFKMLNNICFSTLQKYAILDIFLFVFCSIVIY
jgi:hypothetical protein